MPIIIIFDDVKNILYCRSDIVRKFIKAKIKYFPDYYHKDKE